MTRHFRCGSKSAIAAWLWLWNVRLSLQIRRNSGREGTSAQGPEGDMRPLPFMPLIHHDPASGVSVQQTSEMKTRELIVGLLTNVPCECGHCSWITALQFPECIQVA